MMLARKQDWKQRYSGWRRPWAVWWIAAARAEGAALQEAMDAVSARLDGAINSVHALLDE